MTSIRYCIGKLIGNPFIASVDTTGKREDKKNCVLLVNGYLIPKGYKAYIFRDSYAKEYISQFVRQCQDASIVSEVKNIDILTDFDVIAVSDDGFIQRLYRDNSPDNVLFVTNQCNSNCIMCPDSMKARTQNLNITKEKLLYLLELIPNDTHHLTITGGEPTLMKWDLLDVLQKCQQRFENTDFLMLTNGRSLCVEEYREKFCKTVPAHFRLAIPLYGTDASSHDRITQAIGSFEQTTNALLALQSSLQIEIRLVVMKLNYLKLPEIADFIASQFPETYTVSFMGMELLGNAAINRDSLWVDYQETAAYIDAAIKILIHAGIDARIYNYPLCALPEHLWTLTAKSISDYKVRYYPECDDCLERPHCGGFFFSTITYDPIKVRPIREEDGSGTKK